MENMRLKNEKQNSKKEKVKENERMKKQEHLPCVVE
jgi:hypothetical protein